MGSEEERYGGHRQVTWNQSKGHRETGHCGWKDMGLISDAICRKIFIIACNNMGAKDLGKVRQSTYSQAVLDDEKRCRDAVVGKIV
jgi:hypothetical protein